MNFASFAPVNYGIEPMDLTPLTKRMSDVMTLADMMDKSKANKLALQKTQAEMDAAAKTNALLWKKGEMDIAEEERKQAIRSELAEKARKDLEAVKVPAPSMADYPALPTPPSIISPDPQALYSELTGLKPSTPENIERMKEVYPDIAPAEATFSPYKEYGNLKNIEGIIKPGATGYGIRLPSAEGYTEGLPKPYEEYARTSPIAHERAQQEAARKQVEEANAAELAKREAAVKAYDPKSRIPLGERWKTPDEHAEELRLTSIDPELGQKYRKSLLDQREILAKAGTAEAKNKGMMDFLAGSILDSLGPNATPDQSVQALLLGGFDAENARKYADTKDATLASYKMSAPYLAKQKTEADLKKQEADAKRQEENDAWEKQYKLKDQALKQQQINMQSQAIKDKATEKELKRLTALNSTADKATIYLGEAEKLIADLEKNPTGLTSSFFASVNPYGSNADRKKQFNLIKHNLGFTELLDLKRQGATFGDLTNREYANVLSSITTLDFDSSNENNIRALKAATDSYRRLISAVQKEGVNMPESNKNGGGNDGGKLDGLLF